jgi:hypothetical protein
MANLTTFELLTMDMLIDNVADFKRTEILEMAIGKIEMDDMFEGNVNEAEMEDITKACGITLNAAKGVLGSLAKKGYVWFDHEDEMMCPTMFGVRALIEDVRNY